MRRAAEATASTTFASVTHLEIAAHGRDTGALAPSVPPFGLLHPPYLIIWTPQSAGTHIPGPIFWPLASGQLQGVISYVTKLFGLSTPPRWLHYKGTYGCAGACMAARLWKSGCTSRTWTHLQLPEGYISCVNYRRGNGHRQS